MKGTFWQDASRGGAVLGLVYVVSSALGMYIPQIAILLSIITTVVVIYLMIYFTRKRAAMFAKEGYHYGKCFGFSVAMGLFAGFVTGAYEIVAANYLFTEEYHYALSVEVAAMRQLCGSFMTADSLDMMEDILRAMMFSPIWVLLSQIFAQASNKAFFGLFVAMAAKRAPQVFDESGDYEAEADDEEDDDEEE